MIGGWEYIPCRLENAAIKWYINRTLYSGLFAAWLVALDGWNDCRIIDA
jgi:hypothetical protein